MLLLARDMALNGGGRSISAAAADLLVSTVRRLTARATELGAGRVVGVATAVFRAADNGGAVLDRVATEAGVRAEIISQGEPGCAAWGWERWGLGLCGGW